MKIIGSTGYMVLHRPVEPTPLFVNWLFRHRRFVSSLRRLKTQPMHGYDAARTEKDDTSQDDFAFS